MPAKVAGIGAVELADTIGHLHVGKRSNNMWLSPSEAARIIAPRPDEPALVFVGLHGCEPCDRLSQVLDEALRSIASPPAVYRIKTDFQPARLQEAVSLVGRPISLFPTMAFRKGGRGVAWIRGANGKGGPITPKQLASWIKRHSNYE